MSVGWALELPHRSTDDFTAKLKRIDFVGAITLVIANFALLLGLDQGGNVSWTSPLVISSLAVAFIFYPLFMLVELRWAAEPFAPKHIMVNPALLASYLCNAFAFAGGLCLVFYISLYFQAALQRTAAQAGLFLLPTIFGSVTGSLFGGILMQKTGKFKVLTIAAYTASFIGAILVTLLSGLVATTVPGICIGMCFALSSASTDLGTGLMITSFGNGSSPLKPCANLLTSFLRNRRNEHTDSFVG